MKITASKSRRGFSVEAVLRFLESFFASHRASFGTTPRTAAWFRFSSLCWSYRAGVIVNNPPPFRKALPDQRKHAADIPVFLARQMPVP